MTAGAAPEQAIADLLAKQEITEVLYRYGRGMDRMDAELTLSCWHPDGTDDHAPLYRGSAAGFVAWLWPVHAAMVSTRHVVTNILVTVDGDRAGSECYVRATLRLERDGQLVDLLGAGRYLDTFERIDGRWAIRHRQYISEWNRVEPVTTTQADLHRPLIVPNNPEAPRVLGRRDRDDPSYAVLRA